MSPDQAATIIQSAWRNFDHDRKAEFMARYEDELNDTYYGMVYPIDYIEF